MDWSNGNGTSGYGFGTSDQYIQYAAHYTDSPNSDGLDINRHTVCPDGSSSDVGFVHAGQAVTVKVETFNFTKYGTVEGEVISMPSDAIEDEKRGSISSSKIRLDRETLRVSGADIKSSPGMAVTVDAKTDTRRVDEYFLSSLQQHVGES